ncbi:MAG: TlpA disulfide reductase family protein [Anaerolineales bacterium]
MNKKNLALGLFLSGLVLVLGAAWLVVSALFFHAVTTDAAGGEKAAAPKKGFIAPDFTLQDLEGQTYTLSDLRGRPVLLNFWATWCPPCRAEMPAIGKVYEDYRAQGFVVLAVTADDTYNDAADFSRQYALPFPVLVDSSANVARTYNINSLPTSFFIAPDGVIRAVVIGGPMSEASIRSHIEALWK